MDTLVEKLKNLPDESGVYIMLDEKAHIIYIGKARVLKNRVRQYFHSSGVLSDKTAAMVARIADFNYIITATESDALALEANLIKKHKPQYNVLLKDDKHFPYIRVNLSDDFPRFILTRKVKKDGAKYFGPYMGGVRVRDLLDIISSAYNIRLCNLNFKRIPKNHRSCLNFQIGKCAAPCMGSIGKKEYKERVLKAVDFLSGKDNAIKKILTDKMMTASMQEQYEAAAFYRDRIIMVDKLKIDKLAMLPAHVNLDVFSYHTDGIYGAVSMLVIREGNMEGVQNFSVSDAGLSDEDTVLSFLSQYYSGDVNAPDEVVCDVLTENTVLEQYLYQLFSKKVKVSVPQRGVKKKLADMAGKNANEYVVKYLESIKHRQQLTQGAVEMLAQVLNLATLPLRIECYDISHISGTDKSASMTVFINGEKQPSLYRRFKIRTVEGNDDFASMAEVIKRRFERIKGKDEQDISFSAKPDLVVIDGGLGQLHKAQEILRQLEVDVELISLAERNEQIFTVHSSKPIELPKSSLAIRLLQRIRDEAHRFALAYHRKLRSNRISSELDNIPGIGKARKKALILKFHSLESIKKATLTELAEVDGISEVLAKNIYNYFNA